MKSAASLSAIAIMVSLFLYGMTWVGSKDHIILEPYKSLFESAAMILIPIFLVASVFLAGMRNSWQNPISGARSTLQERRSQGLRSLLVSLVSFLGKAFIIALLLTGIDYVVSGRYNDHLNIVDGFMDMDWGKNMLVVLALFSFLEIHARNSRSNEREKS